MAMGIVWSGHRFSDMDRGFPDMHRGICDMAMGVFLVMVTCTGYL